MSSAVNESLAIRHFEHSNVIKIRDVITDFYMGLPHILPFWCTFWHAIATMIFLSCFCTFFGNALSYVVK